MLESIVAKRQEYDTGCNIEQRIEEMKDLLAAQGDDITVDAVAEREVFVRDLLSQRGENFDDFSFNPANAISAIRTRTNVLSKEEYCHRMRTTNERQREIILEFIHRLTLRTEPRIQIFFTGPAGCGKTYVLKLIMETVNRYSQTQNSLNNAYVACASTGKAAVNLEGTTVHSAFHITQSRRVGAIARETLQSFRQMFANVRCIIIDEVSMIGSDVLHKVNHRLQEVTGEVDGQFGGLNIVFCGDFC